MDQKVSVIIPVYNGETFIARAIGSVLAQTVKPHEIIVINDGSKDGTEMVLRSFGESIRTVTIPNGGVSNARNTGIRMAQGDFVAFLDADDVWHADKLEKQLGSFTRHPETGLCCCDYSIFDSYRQVTVTHFTVLKGTHANFDAPLKMLPVKLLLAVNFVGTCSTVMIRKALLDRVGHFNVTYKQSEDFELWLRLGCHAQFILLKESLVDKKIHSSNLTNNLKESYSFHLKVLADIRDSLGEYIRNNALKTDYQQDISRTHYKLGELYFNDGSAGDAFHHYWMGLSSCWSLSNLGRYLTVMFKKILRSASFGLLSRKTFEKRLPGEVKNAG